MWAVHRPGMICTGLHPWSPMGRFHVVTSLQHSNVDLHAAMRGRNWKHVSFCNVAFLGKYSQIFGRSERIGKKIVTLAGFGHDKATRPPRAGY